MFFYIDHGAARAAIRSLNRKKQVLFRKIRIFYPICNSFPNTIIHPSGEAGAEEDPEGADKDPLSDDTLHPGEGELVPHESRTYTEQ